MYHLNKTLLCSMRLRHKQAQKNISSTSDSSERSNHMAELDARAASAGKKKLDKIMSQGNFAGEHLSKQGV